MAAVDVYVWPTYFSTTPYLLVIFSSQFSSAERAGRSVARSQKCLKTADNKVLGVNSAPDPALSLSRGVGGKGGSAGRGVRTKKALFPFRSLIPLSCYSFPLFFSPRSARRVGRVGADRVGNAKNGKTESLSVGDAYLSFLPPT